MSDKILAHKSSNKHENPPARPRRPKLFADGFFPTMRRPKKAKEAAFIYVISAIHSELILENEKFSSPSMNLKVKITEIK